MPHRTRVLVVDVNQDMDDSLLALLKSHGYNAKGVYSARTIVADVRDFDPDVIIIDVALPGTNGWDAAREVRQHEPGTRPILIAITGHTPGRGQNPRRAWRLFLLSQALRRKVLLKLVASRPTN
jgi:CheY-like chemotaxis protein